MIVKLAGVAKACLYRLKFGSRFVFEGLPVIHKRVDIKITQGKMKVGKGFSAKPGTYFAVVNKGKLTCNKGVTFGRNCILVCHDSITIGNNVCFGPNVLIYDHDHKFDIEGVREGFRTSPIHIEDNCWIGAGVIILRGTTIGEGTIIGAGTVVRGEIPPHSVVTSDRQLQITPITFKE